MLEAFPRRFAQGFPLLPSGAAAVLANPLLCRKNRLQKAFFTFAMPLVPMIGLSDLFVSVGRIHQPEELISLAREAGVQGYRWRHGLVPFPMGGEAYYFWGAPV